MDPVLWMDAIERQGEWSWCFILRTEHIHFLHNGCIWQLQGRAPLLMGRTGPHLDISPVYKYRAIWGLSAADDEFFCEKIIFLNKLICCKRVLYYNHTPFISNSFGINFDVHENLIFWKRYIFSALVKIVICCKRKIFWGNMYISLNKLLVLLLSLTTTKFSKI